jgi:hypothetical protein
MSLILQECLFYPARMSFLSCKNVFLLKWQTTLSWAIDEFFTQGKLLLEITFRNKGQKKS